MGRIGICVAALAATLVSSGLVSSGANAQDLYGTLKKIKDNGEIVVGHRESSPPFASYNEQGKPVGYTVDLCMKIVDEVKKELSMPDLKVRFLPVNPSTRIPLMANGTIDLECGSTTHNLTREQQVSFLSTTFITGASLTTRKDSGIKEVEDLAGKAVAVAQGTTNERILRAAISDYNIPNVDILSVKDHAEGMLALETDRVDAYCNDEIVSFGMVAKSKMKDELAVVGRLLSYDPYAIMVRRDDSAFELVGNRTLADLFRTGEIKQIYAKWFDPIGVKLGPKLATAFEIEAYPY